jgi:hypothetical protein
MVPHRISTQLLVVVAILSACSQSDSDSFWRLADSTYVAHLPEDAQLNEKRIRVTQDETSLRALFPASIDSSAKVRLLGTVEVRYLGAWWEAEGPITEPIEDLRLDGSHIEGSWSISGINLRFDGEFQDARSVLAINADPLGSIRFEKVMPEDVVPTVPHDTGHDTGN